jgi:hypothetical protein
MAKNSDSTPETIETISAAGAQAANPQVQLQIDDASAPVTYSTTVRVWGSAEEFNLDFAGPLRPAGQGAARLKIDQRLVLNPWAAKRLAIALGQAVGRYEQTYGALELDERKRRVAAPAGAAAPAKTADSKK